MTYGCRTTLNTGVFLHHGRVRQGERGITDDQIKDAVLNSRSWGQSQGTHGGVEWAFEKVIEGDTLRVAGEITGDTVYVITAFWVRR
jgi:hypothetical protein